MLHRAMMQAIQVVKAGEPLALTTVPIPKASKSKVVIKQQYSSVNPMDWKIAKFNPFKANLPITLGHDASGIVHEVGEGVTRFKVGDAVFGICDIPGGGFAQYVETSEKNLVKRVNQPADVAGAAGVVFGTVYNPLFLVDDITKRKGQTIFIAGGGGGLGHVAVQLAKHHGMKVIASASKPESIQLSKECGADHVIDYSKADVVAEVLKLTNGEGVDLAFDPTYVSSSFVQSAKVTKKGGKWIRVGGLEWNMHANDEEARKVCVERGVEPTSGDLGRYWRPDYAPRSHEVLKMYEECDRLYKEGVKVKVSKVVPLTDVDAVNAVELDNEKGRIFGKVVIEAEKAK